MDESDPFKRTKLAALQEKVKLYANRNIINHDSKNMNLDSKTAGMKLRDRQKVQSSIILITEKLYLSLLKLLL